MNPAPSADRPLKRILRDAALLALVLVPFELWINVEWTKFMGTELQEYLADMARPTPADTRVVVLGDSHPRNAFLYAHLPDSIADLTYGAESLREAHLKLRTLLRRGIRPRCVVIEADPHGFSPYREVTNNEQTVVLGANLKDYNEVYARSLSGVKKAAIDRYPLFEQQNRAALTMLLIEKYLRRLVVAPPPLKAPAATARAPAASAAAAAPAAPAPAADPAAVAAAAVVDTTAESPWSQLPPEGRQKVATGRLAEQFSDPFVVSPGLRDTWYQIIALCRSWNIRVVAVRYPLSNEYRAGLARYNLSGIATTLRAIPPDTILDYSALYEARPNYFHDSDHLSPAGSVAFGARFQTDLRAVLARPLSKEAAAAARPVPPVKP